MGFLNLSAWRPVGGAVPAERRATSVQAQSHKYYYDNFAMFQGMVDRFAETEGHRPPDLAALYIWQLEQERAVDSDDRALDLADVLAYYDIEQHSQLAMVAIDPDKATRARKLLEARQLYRMKRIAVQRRAQRPRPGLADASEAGQTADQSAQPAGGAA